MSEIAVGDKVWHKSILYWERGTVLAVARWRVLVKDDSYATINVTHWRPRWRVFRIP